MFFHTHTHWRKIIYNFQWKLHWNYFNNSSSKIKGGGPPMQGLTALTILTGFWYFSADLSGKLGFHGRFQVNWVITSDMSGELGFQGRYVRWIGFSRQICQVNWVFKADMSGELGVQSRYVRLIGFSGQGNYGLLIVEDAGCWTLYQFKYNI